MTSNAAKILIVEDQLLTAENMRQVLEEHGFTVLGIAASGEEAINAANRWLPDVVIMDIHLQGAIDGISAAKIITSEQALPIIYVTENASDAVFQLAKTTCPRNFLTKPFSHIELVRSVELALNQSSSPTALDNDEDEFAKFKSEVFYVSINGQGYVRMLTHDILFIEANGSYADIYLSDLDTGSKRHRVSISSNQVVEQLCCHTLLRVHRSYYVNVKKVDKIVDQALYIGAHRIQIGKKFRQVVQETFTILRQK